MAAHPSSYPTLFGCAAGTGGNAVVLGAPYDRGSPPLHAGCASAPSVLRGLSAPAFCRADVNGLYDQHRREQIFPAGALSDLGDLRFRVHAGDDSYLAQIGDFARVLAREGKRPLVLGGDHLITLAVLRGIAAAGKTFQVVQLDAHHDYETLEPGEMPTHGSFVAHIAREGLARQILQVGVRGYSWGVPAAPANVRSVRSEELAAALLPGIPTYLTVDTDGFDPTVAGAVNFPEHEGLTLRDLDQVLVGIAASSSLMGADWTEYNPALDTRNHLSGQFVVRGIAHILRYLTTPLSLTDHVPAERVPC